MINFLSNVSGAFVLSFCYMLFFSKLVKRQIDFKSGRFLLGIIFTTIFMLFNFFYSSPFIRIIFVTLIFMLSSMFVFKTSFSDSIIGAVYIELLINIVDLLYCLVVVYFFSVDINSLNLFFGTLLPNIFVSLFLIAFSRIAIFQHIYLRIMTISKVLKNQKILTLSFILILSLNVMLALLYYKLNIYYFILIDLLLLSVYFYIVIINLKTSNENYEIQNENVNLLQTLSEYENMVDRQRVDNHENKNQLLIIKNMIKKKDKDVISYIETIVEDEKEDDELLYTKVKNIPSGGLQGIIYQKMLTMKDKHILFSLDVARDVRKISLDMLSMDDNYRLCKIIGVLLDNAIEEILDISDKRIMISLYIDDGMLNIEIDNNFEGKIDLDKIDDEGFTTKGDGHGYGLALVRKIISDSNIFINERKIVNDVFKQIIKVKIKNN